jgi:hypothetical protein
VTGRAAARKISSRSLSDRPSQSDPRRQCARSVVSDDVHGWLGLDFPMSDRPGLDFSMSDRPARLEEFKGGRWLGGKATGGGEVVRWRAVLKGRSDCIGCDQTTVKHVAVLCRSRMVVPQLNNATAVEKQF